MVGQRDFLRSCHRAELWDIRRMVSSATDSTNFEPKLLAQTLANHRIAAIREYCLARYRHQIGQLCLLAAHWRTSSLTFVTPIFGWLCGMLNERMLSMYL